MSRLELSFPPVKRTLQYAFPHGAFITRATFKGNKQRSDWTAVAECLVTDNESQYANLQYNVLQHTVGAESQSQWTITGHVSTNGLHSFTLCFLNTRKPDTDWVFREGDISTCSPRVNRTLTSICRRVRLQACESVCVCVCVCVCLCWEGGGLQHESITEMDRTGQERRGEAFTHTLEKYTYFSPNAGKVHILQPKSWKSTHTSAKTL